MKRSEGRKLRTLELPSRVPSLPLCVWTPQEGTGQLVFEVRVRNGGKVAFTEAQLRARLSGRRCGTP